jgi:hypothetical protein
MTNHGNLDKAPARKARRGLIAALFFVAFGVLGLLFGFGRRISTGGAFGTEVCRATCAARGERGGTLVRPEYAVTGPRHGPKTCECR